jgi:hypothetical protein
MRGSDSEPAHTAVQAGNWLASQANGLAGSIEAGGECWDVGE